MRFGDSEGSDNIEDRRGESGRSFGGAGSIGIGTVVLALVAWYFGIDPSFVLNGASVLQGGDRAGTTAAAPVHADAHEESLKRFVAQVLRDTEKTWQAVFQASGREYEAPVLVLFRGATRTGCGEGQAATGPFYCPADRKVYIDLGFYELLRQRFKAPGDAAQAYVIAHEVGHHVQNLLGISARVDRARARATAREGNALSVRLELQADCLAGVWFNVANRERQVLDAGDIDEVLTAATAIGDDTLQKNAQGYVSPDSFTHGSAAQRKQWFRTGFDSGQLRSCDTFRNAGQ